MANENNVKEVDTLFFNTEKVYKDSVPTRFLPEGEHLDELSIGYRMGAYYVPVDVPEIGQGGQAKIYECFCDENDDVYVAKIYDKDNEQIENVRQSNEQIMDIVAHNIAHIYAAGDTDDGNHYMVVMEKYLPLEAGYLCFERHEKEANYRTRLHRVVKDLNEALKQLHIRQIYHADIKPTNIMTKFEENGRACMVLVDFGGSVFVEEEEKRKGKNSARGAGFSPGYQAPELWMGILSESNERTDTYSLGVALAEMIAGVYPRISDLTKEEASKEQKEYYARNKDGKRVSGILLPVGLPDYIVRLLEGLLYYDLDEPENQNYRWGDSKVDIWLESAMEGDYETAASMRFGTEQAMRRLQTAPAQEHISTTSKNQKETTQKQKIFVPYESDTEIISSTEDMAELFFRRADETIDLLRTNEGWANCFSAFGSDVVQVLLMTGKKMEKEPKEVYTELKKLVQLFGSEEIREKSKSAFYYIGENTRIACNSKEEFGNLLFAALSAECKMGSSLRQIFDTGCFVEAIYDGALQEQIKNGGEAWNVDDELLEVINSLEHFSKYDHNIFATQEEVVKLFHIAFRLQNFACFKLGDTLYTSYQKFLQDIAKLEEAAPEEADHLLAECMVGKRYRIDFFAWLLACDEVVEKPSWNMAQEWEVEKYE